MREEISLLMHDIKSFFIDVFYDTTFIEKMLVVMCISLIITSISLLGFIFGL